MSDWTPDLLLLHLRSLLDGHDRLIQTQLASSSRMLDERYATQTKALDAAFLAQQAAVKTSFDASEKAVNAALLAAKEAVDKANAASEARFASVNEFRAQLNDAQTRLLPRNEADTRFKSLDDRMSDMKSTIDKGFSASETKSATGKDNWGYLVGAVGLVAVFVTMAMSLIGK